MYILSYWEWLSGALPCRARVRTPRASRDDSMSGKAEGPEDMKSSESLPGSTITEGERGREGGREGGREVWIEI